jgi:hypothetical protein
MLFVSAAAPDGRSQTVDLATGNTHRAYKSVPATAAHAPCFVGANGTLLVPQDQNALFTFSLTMQQPLRKDILAEKLTALAASPCGRLLVGGALSGCIYVWHLGSGEMLRIIKGQLRRIQCVAFSPDGGFFASASVDSTCKVYRTDRAIRGEGPQCTISAHTLAVNACAFFRSAPYIATASSDRSCRVHDVLTGTQIVSLNLDSPAMCLAVPFADDRLVVGCGSGAVYFASLYEADDEQRLVKRHMAEDGHQKAVLFAGVLSGSSVVTVSEDGVVLAWSSETRELEREVVRFKHTVCNATLMPHIHGSKAADAMPSRAVALKKFPNGSLEEYLVPITSTIAGLKLTAQEVSTGVSRMSRAERKRARKADHRTRLAGGKTAILFDGGALEGGDSSGDDAAEDAAARAGEARRRMLLSPLDAEKERLQARNASLLELANQLFEKAQA